MYTLKSPVDQTKWLVFRMIHELIGFPILPMGLRRLVFGMDPSAVSMVSKQILGGGFKYIFYVHPYFGKIPNLTSIFLKWVGSTTHQNIFHP